MKQIAAVCAAAALYIFTVFASARVQAQPAVQVDAPETPPAHTESASLSTGASTTAAATVPATTRPSAPSATAPPAVPSADAWYLSSIPLSRDLQRFTYELCERLEISYPLVLGVMKVESDFRTGALRKGEGADMVGIMQINSRYLASHYKRYGVTDAYTPRDNITIGVNMLAESIGKNGVHYGLMEYNMGIVNMRKKRDAGVTTTSYTRKVTAAAAGYEQELKKQGFSI